jgi:hypothetical protein
MQERENVQIQLARNELPLQRQKIAAQKKIDDLIKDLEAVQAEIDQISPASPPAPVTNQAEMAINDAKTESIRKAAKIIWSMGTNDEKLVFSMAPVSNAENIAADMSDSVQNGVATASSLYSTSQKQAQDYTAAHYMPAKLAIQQHEDMQAQLTALQEQRQELIRQRDQMQEQIDAGIVPNIDQTEVEIDGEVHVFTADYDAVNKRYIIHDSNPTDDPEVEAEKAQYDIDLRSNMNMENYYAERNYDQQVRIDNLNTQLNVLDGDIAQAEAKIEGHQ